MNILVYDGNPDFGGHQVMACHGIDALATDPDHEITCMLNPGNEKLAERISRCPAAIRIVPAPCRTHRFQGLLNHASQTAIAHLAKQFSTLNAELILCIQGDIEDSSQALLAAKKAGIECVSYLAIPHPMQWMGAKLGKLRDQTNQYLFTLPSRYMVISASMQQLLRQRGATAPIRIVPNGIPSPPPKPAKAWHAMPRQPVLGMLGRIEFNQKQQDFMVRCFCDHPEVFGPFRLVIAGSGPDEEKLCQLIRGCARKDDILLLPWQEDHQKFYDEIDVLMLPSRFEGVPLVMLEALIRGIPVIATRRDGMQDLLPDDWTFPFGRADELADIFSAPRSSWQHHIESLQEKMAATMTLNAFKQNFSRAVTHTQHAE